MSLKVLITGSTPRLGLAFQFVQLATWLQRQGTEVIMTGCDGEATPGLFRELKSAGVAFHDVPGLRRTGIPQLLRPSGELRSLLERLRPDVAVITAVGHTNERPRMSGCGTRVVWWLQSVRNTTFYAKFARRLAAWTANRWADQTWIQCELERRQMSLAGIDERRVRMVPTPIDVDWWRRTAEDTLPSELKEVAAAKTEGRPILVYPASLLPAKRHDTLLRATAIVKQEFPKVLVCCPGRFSAAPLRALVEQLGLQGQVMFTESLVRQEAIPPLLRAADVHVFSSESETYGKALIEALCIGTPTVSTRVGIAYEMEQAGVAKVCDVGDHRQMAANIVAVLRDPALAEQMRSQARQWIDENYSFDAVGGRMLSLLTELARN